MNRKGLWLLLTLAALIVAVSVLVAVAISADGAPANSGEIEDFSYQTVRDADVHDSDTDLRFLFSIRADKLGDYRAVGFVFSKNNSNPVKESRIVDAEEKRNYFSTDNVYNSVNANGSPIAAPDGRYWVAVSLSDIGHSYFDGALYVRPFVEDTDGTTRYGETKYITVCSALGHTHTVSNAAASTHLYREGTCSYCGLENVKQFGADTNPEYQRWVGGGASTSWIEYSKISDILKEGQTFHPTLANPQGNDLYAEFSILWNESCLNLSGTESGGGRFEAIFASKRNNSTSYDNIKAIAYCSLTNNVSDSGSKIAGAFEYPCPQISTSEDGNPYPNMNKNKQSYASYPNLGGTSQNYPEWGWHRIGIVYHEDVTNLDAVASSGATAQYKLTVTIYLDGEVISILSGTDLYTEEESVRTADYKLYTVEKVGEDLVYTDIDGDYYFLLMKMVNFRAFGQDAYFVDGDFFVTAGHSFVLPVTRIDNPAARTETINGQTFNGAFYYTTAGAHEHAWGSLVNDASALADCETPATQSIHCIICGATKPDSTVNLPIDPNLHNWGLNPVRVTEPTLLENGIDRYTCTVCSAVDNRAVSYEHDVQKWTNSTSGSWMVGRQKVATIRSNNGGKQFYTAGNDLLIEYSVLWDQSVQNIKGDSSNSYIDTRFVNSDNADSKNIIYWSVGSNLAQSDCEFAGGFEWGGIPKSDEGNPYPKFTSALNNGGLGLGTTRDEYPNIGGNNPGSGLSQGDTQWGWHRVSIRYREVVTNVDAVKNGTTAQYRLTMWVYIDGTLVIKAYNTDLISDKSVDRKLFSASGSDGNITYTPNDNQYLIPVRLNQKQAQSGKTVYFEIADLSVTIGSTFVQNVRKVASPTPATLEVENGKYATATMWYELAD